MLHYNHTLHNHYRVNYTVDYNCTGNGYNA
jgi:hypothetical protein